jgi:hypothetical protein
MSELMVAKGGTGIAKTTGYIDYHSEIRQKMLPCKDQPREYPNK